MKRIKYSKVKKNTAAWSIISRVLTIIGNSVEPSSNDGKVCRTNVRVESSTTDNDKNPNIWNIEYEVISHVSINSVDHLQHL